MRPLLRPLLAPLLMILTTALAAEGGVTVGLPLFAGDTLSSDRLESVTLGGFGYGSNVVGTRIGGFGLGFLQHAEPVKLQGGFGGLILGQEFFLGPLTAAVSSWTGLGHVALAPVRDGAGFFALYEELTLELGFGPLPWVELVAYGGYQVIASVSDGFLSTIVYNPVVGIRVVFG